MPNFDRVLQSDNRQKVRITVAVTNASGIPYNPAVYYSVGNYTGKLRSTLCNRTRRPSGARVLLPHPVEHSEINSSGSVDTVTVVKPYLGGRVPAATLSGQLAAYCGEGAIFTLPARPAVDPRALACLVTAVSKSSQPSLDVGMMLAEATETLEMLNDPLVRLRKSFNPLVQVALKHNMLRMVGGPLSAATRKGLDKMRDAWLLYRYGITPFIMDVNSVVEHINKKLKATTSLRKSHHNMTLSDNTTEFRVGPSTSLPGVYLWGCRTSTTKQTVFASDLFMSSLDGAADFGVGLYDLPNIIWEKVPYSFVVDWIFDVGKWIRAITPKPGVTHLANYISTKTEVINKFQIDRICYTNPEGNPGYPSVACSSHYDVHASAYGRNIGYTLPAYPSVNYNTFNWKHAVDGVALAWQLLPSFKR